MGEGVRGVGMMNTIHTCTQDTHRQPHLPGRLGLLSLWVMGGGGLQHLSLETPHDGRQLDVSVDESVD